MVVIWNSCNRIFVNVANLSVLIELLERRTSDPPGNSKGVPIFLGTVKFRKLIQDSPYTFTHEKKACRIQTSRRLHLNPRR